MPLSMMLYMTWLKCSGSQRAIAFSRSPRMLSWHFCSKGSVAFSRTSSIFVVFIFNGMRPKASSMAEIGYREMSDANCIAASASRSVCLKCSVKSLPSAIWDRT